MIDNIKTWVIKQISGPMVGRLIRHGLTVVAGVLAGSEIAGLSDLAAYLMLNIDPLAGKLTAAAFGLIALLLSVRSDKKKVK